MCFGGTVVEMVSGLQGCATQLENKIDIPDLVLKRPPVSVLINRKQCPEI